MSASSPSASTPSWAPLVSALEHGLLQRDVAVRALLLGLLAGEHVLLMGPPGTAKSALARRLHQLLPGSRWFERLLTRFSVPEELFGPLSLQALEHDRYERLTEGYLPQAKVVFLDEVFKANSAILNTLLGVLNERRFDNGTLRQPVPLRCLIGASNEVPRDDSLQAFFDRFLLRVPVQPVDDAHFAALLQADAAAPAVDEAVTAALAPERLAALQRQADGVALRPELLALLHDARQESGNHTASDRRWRQIARLLRVQAAARGSEDADALDAWCLPLLLGHDADSVARWTAWCLPRVGRCAPLPTDGLERACSAFEQQLEIEQRAPSEALDDSAGKVALARAMSGASAHDTEPLRIASERARRRYSALHVATRVTQVDELRHTVLQLQQQADADAAAVLPALAAHPLWPPSWRAQVQAAHHERCATLADWRQRVEALRHGFATLPEREPSAHDSAPAHITWSA